MARKYLIEAYVSNDKGGEDDYGRHFSSTLKDAKEAFNEYLSIKEVERIILFRYDDSEAWGGWSILAKWVDTKYGGYTEQMTEQARKAPCHPEKFEDYVTFVGRKEYR